MTTSKTIAGLIGPTLVAIAASMLLNIGSFPALAEQVSRDPALIFVSGILLFVAGLAIVRVHNRWTTASVANVVITGQSYSKSEAVVEAEKAIDRALAPKKVRLVPLPRRSIP